MIESDPSLVPQDGPRITAVTRRGLFDYLRAEGGPWWGRLDEIDFLEPLYDLGGLESTDIRFTTAREDIAKHRIVNRFDWEDDWVLEDPRFRLFDGPDEVLLAFLARVVHPDVQPDTDQSLQNVDVFNRLLGPDGWALRPFVGVLV